MIELISKYDGMDTKIVPEGWDYTNVPIASDGNIQIIMDKINEIIEVVNERLD